MSGATRAGAGDRAKEQGVGPGMRTGSAPSPAGNAIGGEILLLSAFPEAHAGIIRALRLDRFRVRAPRPPRIERLELGSADLVLVDLIHGPGLSRAMIRTLNRRHGRAMVVALHEGSLDPGLRVASDLAIEGFCRPGDCLPTLRALRGAPRGRGDRDSRHARGAPGRPGAGHDPPKSGPATSFVDARRTKSLKSEPPRSVSRKVRP